MSKHWQAHGDVAADDVVVLLRIEVVVEQELDLHPGARGTGMPLEVFSQCIFFSP